MTRELNSPEAVLRSALELKDRLDYAGVIALCDPASIESDFRQQGEHLRPQTEAEFRRDNPDFPVAQAAAAVAHLNRRSAEQIPRHAPGITTYEELVALEPAAYYRHWLEKEDFRLEVIRRMRARGLPVPAAAYDAPPGVTHEIIDVEPLSEREVNVRYRTIFPTDSGNNVDEVDEVDDIEYETLRRADDGTWRLVARHQLLQSRGSVNTILEGELADLFRDDEPST